MNEKQMDRLDSEAREQRAASELAPSELQAQSARCSVADGSKAVSSAEENRLRGLLDDANGKIHVLQSMMAEAGYPMRVKWGEDLDGNEDWVRVRPECQLRDVLRRLAELTNPAPAASNEKAQTRSGESPSA